MIPGYDEWKTTPPDDPDSGHKRIKPCERQLNVAAEGMEQHVQGVREMRGDTYRIGI